MATAFKLREKLQVYLAFCSVIQAIMQWNFPAIRTIEVHRDWGSGPACGYVCQRGVAGMLRRESWPRPRDDDVEYSNTNINNKLSCT